ncbi:uncharacterized protein [Parasteatoda tepidariorum]|uniref:uncharacterized protein n=1 Tax=Parasteatoda tepidariorum TaxID=114398 RepID=UPI00077F8519
MFIQQELIRELKAECCRLRKERDEAKAVASSSKERIIELELECKSLRAARETVSDENPPELEEVKELRRLNRSLQLQVLDKIVQGNLPQKQNCQSSNESIYGGKINEPE